MAAPTFVDALTPKGKIDPADWYPQLEQAEYEARITEFLADGVTEAAAITDEVKNRKAVLNWVYYRAGNEAYNRLALNPATIALLAEGSSSIQVAQIQMVKGIRDEAKAAFDDALAEAAETVVEAPLVSESVAIGFRF